MHIYQVLLSDEPKDVRFRGTLAGVKEVIKAELAPFRAGIRVRELDIATNKEAIVLMLDDPQSFRDSITTNPVILREWRGTARGGLRLTKAAAARRAPFNVDDDAEPGGVSRAHGRDE